MHTKEKAFHLSKGTLRGVADPGTTGPELLLLNWAQVQRTCWDAAGSHRRAGRVGSASYYVGGGEVGHCAGGWLGRAGATKPPGTVACNLRGRSFRRGRRKSSTNSRSNAEVAKNRGRGESRAPRDYGQATGVKLGGPEGCNLPEGCAPWVKDCNRATATEPEGCNSRLVTHSPTVWALRGKMMHVRSTHDHFLGARHDAP